MDRHRRVDSGRCGESLLGGVVLQAHEPPGREHERW